ncbi:MAG TPA: hypothetical protein VNJ04_19570 [Gemmatimonadaceae bacterium]|nr:hypothetical protein [Gemmatimonadaceae bacterium]
MATTTGTIADLFTARMEQCLYERDASMQDARWLQDITIPLCKTEYDRTRAATQLQTLVRLARSRNQAAMNYRARAKNA